MTAYWVEFVYNMDQQDFAPGDPFPATNQLASFLGNPVYGPSVDPVPYSSYPFGYVAQAYAFAIQGQWQLVQQPNGLNWQYQETNVVEWTYTIGIGDYYAVGSQPAPTTLVGPTATASAWDGPPYPNTSPGTVSVQWTTYAWEEINVSPPSGPIANISNAPAVQKSPSQSQVETFTVTLSSASTDTITVDYTTQNGTAVAGTDFQATHGTLTFAPGQTSQTIQVPLLGNPLSNPPSETFSVVLSNLADSGSAGAVLGINTGFGEIDQNALFTSGAETVNFNNLSSDQISTVNAEADLYNALGGGDTITLPNAMPGDKSVAIVGTNKIFDLTHTFSVGDSPAGFTTNIYGGAGSYNVALGAGSEAVSINGAGATIVAAGTGAETFSISGGGSLLVNGDVTLTSASIGTNSILELNGAVSGGAITFKSDGISISQNETLKIDGKTMPTAIITGFASSDTIDLKGVAFDPKSATVLQTSNNSVSANNVLHLFANGSDYQLDLDPSATFSGGFSVSSDGLGGTDITFKAASAVAGAAVIGTTWDYSTSVAGYNATVQIGEPTGLGGGSGFIIGPHTILTAAHVVESIAGVYAGITITEPNGTVITPTNIYANPTWATVANSSGISAATADDWAVINVSQDLSQFGQFKISTDYSGGNVNITGYPQTLQNNEIVTVASNGAGVLQESAPINQHGESGGPAWFFDGSTAWAVGINSNSNQDVLITTSDWQQIQSHMNLGSSSGKVVKGYLDGATVFADANGNGQLDAGEASATTDSTGSFLLSGGTGPLIAFGGIDTSTGLQFKGQLSAPGGSSDITPLTTLLTDLAADSSAQTKVLSALSLSTNLDLTTFDPIAGAQSGNADGAAVEVAGAKVYDTVSLIASALVGAGGAFTPGSEAAFAAIAAAIDGPGVNLNSQSDVSSLITSVAQSESLILSKGVADSVAAIVVATNLELDQKLQADGTGDTLLDDTATVERVVQGTASNAVQLASNDSAQVQALVGAFTGTNLDSAVANALGHLGNNSETTPPTLTAVANQTDEATGPHGAVATFAVTATAPVDGTVPVVFKEGNTVVHSGDTFALGSHTIMASAVDAVGNQSSETFTINVVDTTPPVLTPIADETVHATSAAGASVAFAATATDAVDGTDQVVFTEGNAVVHSGDIFALGSHSITATSTDAAGNTASEIFVVNVADQAPVVSALSGSVGEDGPTYSQNLLAGASDPDSDTLTITGLDATVTTADGRALVLGTDYTLSNSDIALTSAGFAKFNSLAATQTDHIVFHYGVSDGILTTEDSLTLTVVGANDAPIVADQTHNQSISVGKAFSLTLPADTFQDPDSGDHLTLTATLSNGKPLPSWLTFDAATDTLKGTPGVSNVGNLDISIKATDTGGLSATDTFELSVARGIDHAPVITSDGGGACASVIIPDDTEFVDKVTATDPDPGTTIKYSIIGGEDERLFKINPTTGDLSFKSLPKAGHSYQVEVAASDGTKQDTQSIDVQVAKGIFEFGHKDQQDNFVFKPGFGLEIVNNFDPKSSNHDVLELDHNLFHGATAGETGSALLSLIDHHSFQFGSDVLIVTNTHDVIDLEKTNLHSLAAKDFMLT